MKKSMFLSFAAIMVLLLGFATTSYLSAQEENNGTSQQQAQAGSQSDTSAQQQDAKVFTGTIAKKGGALVLKDVTNSTTYQLDDQKKARSYVGKAVKVTGSLDASGNTIHVQDIEITS
jgi:hypothetical protein